MWFVLGVVFFTVRVRVMVFVFHVFVCLACDRLCDDVWFVCLCLCCHVCVLVARCVPFLLCVVDVVACVCLCRFNVCVPIVCGLLCCCEVCMRVVCVLCLRVLLVAV